jgi:tryptophan synthase alpha chain
VSRLESVFARARQANRKALVIYLTAGDPDHETSVRLVGAAIDAGADVVEIGVPWSDPSADGPVIQAAMHRAFASGGGMTRALALTRTIREAHAEAGLVLFGYANPIVVMGPDVFARKAREAGADAVLCVDYPPDEDPRLPTALAREGLDLIPLLAPTSNATRIAAAATAARGFIYYVSMTGITGTSLVDVSEPRAQVAAIRAATSGRLPVVVGFGIKTPETAREVASYADGVAVGSAAVETVRRAVEAKRDPVPELTAFVKSLRAAV